MPGKTAPKDKTPVSLESATQRLEVIIATLEQNDTSLEQSLQSFEEGVTLLRTTQSLLTAAEQKVSLLAEGNEPSTKGPSEPGSTEE